MDQQNQISKKCVLIVYMKDMQLSFAAMIFTGLECKCFVGYRF